MPDKPSIAVLPLKNVPHNSDQEHISDGITEDIITELSRFSELFVIARNSSFQYRDKTIDVRRIGRELGVRYVLEGSFRRHDGRVRIAAQLVDALTGAHRWAERYDRELADVFALQDEFARAFATILVADVNKAEAEHALLKAPASWKAYEYFVRGADILAGYWSTVKVADLYESRRLLERSLQIDPNYARAYASLSTTWIIAWRNRLDNDHLNPAALDEARRLANKAVQLNPNLPQGHASLGVVLAWKRQHDAGVAEFEKAVALNPNFTDWRMAIALVYAGQGDRAVEVLKSHMRLDPFYVPLAPHWLGLAYYTLRQYPDALAALSECALRAPNYGAVHLWLAATHARMGQMDAARAEAARVLALDPGFTIERVAKSTIAFKYKDAEEDCFEAMRLRSWLAGTIGCSFRVKSCRGNGNRESTFSANSRREHVQQLACRDAPRDQVPPCCPCTRSAIRAAVSESDQFTFPIKQYSEKTAKSDVNCINSLRAVSERRLASACAIGPPKTQKWPLVGLAPLRRGERGGQKSPTRIGAPL